jgi:hypothetical protein
MSPDFFPSGHPIDFNGEKALEYGCQKNYIIHLELKINGCLVKAPGFDGQEV